MTELSPGNHRRPLELPAADAALADTVMPGGSHRSPEDERLHERLAFISAIRERASEHPCWSKASAALFSFAESIRLNEGGSTRRFTRDMLVQALMDAPYIREGNGWMSVSGMFSHRTEVTPVIHLIEEALRHGRTLDQILDPNILSPRARQSR